jgi:glycosyltransferase involved in cell wall biosynthesis
MSLISVVIPSYNHESFIKQTVESILVQTHKNLELIVIDDGSTDKSLAYLRNVVDPRFKLIEQENKGAQNAINKGLEMARGDYLAILNSDDIYHPDRLSKCLVKLEAGIDLVASWIEIIDGEGKTLGIKKCWQNMLPWEFNHLDFNNCGLDEFTHHLLESNFVSTTSNIVFSRKVYDEIGGMRNLNFVHDWDFLLRVARRFHCEIIDSPLLKYRVHNSNTISSNRKHMLFEICWIFAVHLKYFTGNLVSCDDNNGYSQKLDFLWKSINSQGNEKVLWMLLHYFDELQVKGEVNPEEFVLNDKRLCDAFCLYINT